jgi:hypothetical protein
MSPVFSRKAAGRLAGRGRSTQGETQQVKSLLKGSRKIDYKRDSLLDSLFMNVILPSHILGICSVADPDPGWVKSQDSDPGSGMNIPDHNSESLETIFWAKILKFLDADAEIFLTLDPGSGIERIRIRDRVFDCFANFNNSYNS